VTQGTMVLTEPLAGGLVIGKVRPNAVFEELSVNEPHYITLSLAFDHRVMDGAYAGGFLTELKKEIEQL